MDKTRAKSQRKSKREKKKEKTSKETPEVFVLPPDLLKKLGITIGHNSQEPADPVCSSIQNESINNTEVSTSSTNNSSTESSILETACLMKQSVFLSPTFVPTANVVSGELEIMSDSYTEEPNIDIVTASQATQPVTVNINATKTNLCESAITSGSKDCHDIEEKETACLKSTDHVKCGNETTDTPQKNEIDLNITNGFISTTDSISEPISIIYETPNLIVNFAEELSDNHQQCSEPVAEVIGDEYQNVPPPKSNKINIISEEIVPISQLKVFNCSAPNLIPVTVDAIISSKKSITNKTLSNGTEDEGPDLSITPTELNNENNNLRIEDEDISDERSSAVVLATCISEDNNNIESINNNDVIVTNGYISPDMQENDVKGVVNMAIISPINVTTSGKTSVIEENRNMQKEYHVNIDTKLALKSDSTAKVQNQDTKDSKYKNPSEIMVIKDKGVGRNCQKITTDSNLGNCNLRNNDNLNLDKVKELAALIQQVYKKKRIPNKIYQSQENKRGKKRKSNSTKIESKAHIQGVEKPGGTEYNENDSHHSIKKSKILKTYQHSKTVKKPQINLNSLKSVAFEATSTENIEQIDIKNIESSTLVQEYCLCYDYGSLAFYEDDNLYEHIHFWQNNKTNLDPEVIFSIYNDRNIDKTVEPNYDVNMLETPEDDVSKICWNNDVKLNDHLNTNIEQPTETVVKSKSVNSIEIDNQMNVDVGTLEDIIGTQNVANINVKSNVLLTSESENDPTVVKSSESKNNATAVNDDTSQENEENLENDEPLVLLPESDQQRSADVKLEPCEDQESENELINSDIPIEQVPNVTQSHETSPIIKVENEENVSQSNEQVSEAEVADISDNIEIVNFNTVVKQEKTSTSDIYKTIEQCVSKEPQTRAVIDVPLYKERIKCGVCSKLFTDYEWTEHVVNDHDYIAWKAGETLDLDDPELVPQLRNRMKTGIFLVCPVCDKMRTRQVHKFIAHLRKCLPQPVESDDEPIASKRRRLTIETNSRQCAVCQLTMPITDWIAHNGKEHNYLAWTTGEKPLDVENKTAVHDHLLHIVRCGNYLFCYKCGRSHRRVESYLTHMKQCDGEKIYDKTVIKSVKTERVQCGVCNDHLLITHWLDHIEKKHNYMAWQSTSEPMDLDDKKAVLKHLLEILNLTMALICKECGAAIKSAKTFMKHLKSCAAKRDSSDSSLNVSKEARTPRPPKNHVPLKSREHKMIKCGVCGEEMQKSDWLDHNSKHHNYLAWKKGETPLNKDDPKQVNNHLKKIIYEIECLTCHKCGLQRKKPGLYLSHVAMCGKKTIESEASKLVKCGVCKEEMIATKWLEHIMNEHNYIAWQEGSPPVDTEDEEAVRLHLNNISRRQSDGLICHRCGTVKKYPKTFLNHIASCDSEISLNKTTSEAETSMSVNLLDTEAVTCGVCKQQVKSAEWFEHIRKHHQYMAWLDGQDPIIESDAEMVYKHLTEIARATDGLICAKCGTKRKYAQAYINHVDTCVAEVQSNVETEEDLFSKDVVKCAICLEVLSPEAWRSHAIENHYNVAWVVGAHAIDLNSPYVVEPYIKEYLRVKKKLVCKICGVSRVSLVGFYAHIIQCGKTEEELDKYKAPCHICHNKYLKIYKSQHMTAHKESELAAERREIYAQEKELRRQAPEESQIPDLNVSGKRKAAEKAQTVIAKYKASLETGQYKCDKCKFGTDIEAELHSHVCLTNIDSDSDESLNLDHYSSDLDSGDSDIDSDISEQEREEADKRKSDHSSSASKVRRLPYSVKSTSAYLRACAEQFRDTYLTEEYLFPQWNNVDYEVLKEEEQSKYMPPIERSCQIMFKQQGEWNQIERLECKIEKGKKGLITAAFVGAYIQCVCWLPAQMTKSPQTMHFAVACHLSTDAPRYSWDETPEAPGLLQIWQCRDQITNMRFVFGIAHDYGAVWAMDWCPSGATSEHRLGLLAIACSNGSAYILSVPTPGEKTPVYCRLKPVAELRFLPKNSTRKKCQATSIKWSSEKGHSNIVVGYSDGTLGYYDISIESPLLKSEEDGVTILYPHNEKRALNACIEAVDMYAGRYGNVIGAGSPCGTWAGGAAGAARAGGTRTHAHVSAPRVAFPPHWPAALLAGEDTIVLQCLRECEAVRRVCGAGGCAGGCGGCAWCARHVLCAPPLLRAARSHPAAEDIYKNVIATIQMFPLNPNKKQRANDGLAMTVEPFTYEEAIKKYGIEFVQITGKDKATQQSCRALPKDVCPDRFPLTEVTNVLFCPAPAHHQKLLISMRPGLIIIMTA